ncbi:MAG: polyphosphate kinase 1 [Acidobacteria bacterium]|nr:MAG: polyphosphate kinase 1 [Acidobacteriota bacterium]
MSKKQPQFFNRELSWLEFNQRVLDEALDKSVPLLERLNFLAITGSNLDEFFMVRVGGLQILKQQAVPTRDHTGLTPGEQLAAISQRVHEMTAAQYRCFGEELEPGLAGSGVRRLRPADLSERQKERVEGLFERDIFPIVTPMAVDARQRFPLLLNLGLNVAVRLKVEETARSTPESGPVRPSKHFAIIPLGSRPDRFIQLPEEAGYAYILLEDVIQMFIDRFFPGQTVLEHAVFRITRNADLSVREDMAGDLLAEMKEVLDARKESSCVRLEVEKGTSKVLLAFLTRVLKVSNPSRDSLSIPGPLDLSAFRKLASLDQFPSLRYEAWPPVPSPDIDRKTSIFKELANRSIFLYHPFDSFEPVIRLLQEAAADPDVLAIKQILYRTSRNSPIIEALRQAAENGKYVTAIVELKARFDEARNIGWARELEHAGVQVIYGVKGLKTHAKLCIVVRREAQGVVRYLHFGTGNYNEITARLYTDASYFSVDPDLAKDASAFFNAITGYSQPHGLVKLQAAPTSLRSRFLELIESEAERRRQGQKALIMVKMNSLVDAQIIKALYQASKVGVKILLNVRGICCLRPGVKGLSDNITVISIVDRFLEHSRIYYFHQGGEPKIFISSADWMPRNLDRRVELLVPIEDAPAQKRVISILDTCFKDNVKGRKLLPNGQYERVIPPPGKKGLRSQEALYQQAVEVVRQVQTASRTVFQAFRPAG